MYEIPATDVEKWAFIDATALIGDDSIILTFDEPKDFTSISIQTSDGSTVDIKATDKVRRSQTVVRITGK